MFVFRTYVRVCEVMREEGIMESIVVRWKECGKTIVVSTEFVLCSPCIRFSIGKAFNVKADRLLTSLCSTYNRCLDAKITHRNTAFEHLIATNYSDSYGIRYVQTCVDKRAQTLAISRTRCIGSKCVATNRVTIEYNVERQ